jgi:hypothetical protein
MTIEPKASETRIGRDQQPIVVIDDFFPAPEALRESAQSSIYEPARNLYPGIRAELPDFYWSGEHVRRCLTAIARGFNLTGRMKLLDSSFSMVTTPRDELSIGQRLPHPDAFNPRQIALVHFLAHDFTEGTAFYRHRSTGLQSITETDREAYFRKVEDELERCGPPPPGYMLGDNEFFEQIFAVEAKFNRAVLYRGQQLHSGAIGPHTPLNADPSKGRLTVTAFMTID